MDVGVVFVDEGWSPLKYQSRSGPTSSRSSAM
jgi:hypothetical protein